MHLQHIWSNKTKLFLFAGMIALVVVFFSVLYYLGYLEGTVFMMIFDELSEPKWDEVFERSIIKNTIPITVIEKQGTKCVVSALKFDSIINHRFFIKGAELANKLSFDDDAKTLTLNCDEIPDEEKSRLNIWYIIPEEEKFAEKYMYFITVWNSTDPLPDNPE